MLLSFITIGFNEGRFIKQSFESIKEAAIELDLDENEYEIIFVDSNSTDDSIEIASQFNKVKIFKAYEQCNAAAARNIGAENAAGKILFFLDGDMEIDKNHIHEFFIKKGELLYPFLSGNFTNYNYDNNWNYINKAGYEKFFSTQKYYSPVTGGLFIITKELWERVNGMDPVFKKGQDLDLGLRLAKIGVLQLRLPYNLANHHTIPYENSTVKWRALKKWFPVYSRSLLYRKNILNKYTFKRMILSDPSIVVLILSLGLIVFTPYIESILIYLILLFVMVLYKYRNCGLSSILENYIYHFIRDIQVLAGILFFYPYKTLPNYKQIQ